MLSASPTVLLIDSVTVILDRTAGASRNGSGVVDGRALFPSRGDVPALRWRSCDTTRDWYTASGLARQGHFTRVLHRRVSSLSLSLSLSSLRRVVEMSPRVADLLLFLRLRISIVCGVLGSNCVCVVLLMLGRTLLVEHPRRIPSCCLLGNPLNQAPAYRNAYHGGGGLFQDLFCYL